jgi:hypothetical protein
MTIASTASSGDRRSLFSRRKPLAMAMALAVAVSLGACGGGDGNSIDAVTPTPTVPSTTGTLGIAISNGTSCGFSAVHLTIAKVMVNQDAAATDQSSGWAEVVLSPPRRIDILALTNGVRSQLGQATVAAGNYKQMRVVLQENSSTSPLANSVTTLDGREFALGTPSAGQAGLKVNVGLDVSAGAESDYVLDLHVCDNIVPLGNSGFVFTPVVQVLPTPSGTGYSVTGFVASSLVSPQTTVSAQQGGTVVKSTTPSTSGEFILAPLTAGSYEIVVSAPSHLTATITGVPVAAAAPTALNTSAVPIDSPANINALATGLVIMTPSVTPIYAVVVARKTYANGVTVQVAGGPVDGISGRYALAVPGSAPLLATYSAGAALTFTVDSTATQGRYSVAATTGGVTKTSLIDVSQTDALGINFSFP